MYQERSKKQSLQTTSGWPKVRIYGCYRIVYHLLLTMIVLLLISVLLLFFVYNFSLRHWKQQDVTVNIIIIVLLCVLVGQALCSGMPMPYADDPMMTHNEQGVSDLTKCLFCDSVTAPTVLSPFFERQDVSWTPRLPLSQLLNSLDSRVSVML